jgi:lipopolysaccharide export LptBFGC system permease protein LptF
MNLKGLPDKGLASFSVGGVIVLLVFWNLMAHLQLLTEGYSFDYVLGFALQNALFAFIGFVLLGIGWYLIIKGAKA